MVTTKFGSLRLERVKNIFNFSRKQKGLNENRSTYWGLWIKQEIIYTIKAYVYIKCKKKYKTVLKIGKHNRLD